MRHASTSSFGWRPARGIIALSLVAGFAATLAVAGPQLVEITDSSRAPQPNMVALRGAADCGPFTLTQSTNPEVIGNASVACLEGAVSAETSAARAFVAPSTLTLKCVTFGVRINQGGGDWPVEVRILSGDVQSDYGSLDLLSEETVVVPSAANRAFFTVDIPDVSLQAGANFIVEVVSPSRRLADGGDGGQLAFGFNGEGQSALTYFRGPLCGNPDFVDLASLGFPNLHLVMSLGYDEGADSLLIDGFHHNGAGGAILLSDGSDDVIVSGDPLVGPFGLSIPFGDDTSGVQTPTIEWDGAPGTTMSFNYNLASGLTDSISFAATPDGSLALEAALASPAEPLFDVLVFDGDAFVGELPGESSGSVSLSSTDRILWNFFGFCKSRRTTTTFPDGSMTTTVERYYGFGGSASLNVVSPSGTALVGNSIQIRVHDALGALASPPLSVDMLADGMTSFTRLSRDAGVAPGVRFGTAPTAPTVVDGNPTVDIGVLATTLNGSEPIELFGEALATGGPRIRIRTGGLGSSGKDGIPTYFRGVDSANVDIEVVNPDEFGACASFSAFQVGGGLGGTVAFDPCLGCPPPFKGDWINLRGDFTGVGSGTFTLQIAHNGMIVHEAFGVTDLVGASIGWPTKGGKLGGLTPCWRFCYPQDTVFFLASTGEEILMDEVRLLAENAPPLQPLDYIEIRTLNMEAMLLSNPQTVLPPPPEPCVGDTNGDNLVNFSDLNTVLGAFGQSGAGLPGDVNGDGQVNFGDLNTILSNFGNTCP
jgi:hypothetical protein